MDKRDMKVPSEVQHKVRQSWAEGCFSGLMFMGGTGLEETLETNQKCLKSPDHVSLQVSVPAKNGGARRLLIGSGSKRGTKRGQRGGGGRGGRHLESTGREKGGGDSCEEARVSERRTERDHDRARVGESSKWARTF